MANINTPIQQPSIEFEIKNDIGSTNFSNFLIQITKIPVNTLALSISGSGINNDPPVFNLNQSYLKRNNDVNAETARQIANKFSLKSAQNGSDTDSEYASSSHSQLWWNMRSFSQHFIAGALAGGVSRTCTAPLDRLKVFLQVHSNKKTNYNVLSAMRHMYREGGIWSFWRGNFMNVVKIAPESALKFGAYEQIKLEIQRVTHRDKLTACDRFLAGSFAGAFSQTIIYPLEVLKTRLALRKTGDISRRQGIIHFAVKIYNREGVASFYRGFWPNLCGIIPYAGIDLAVYETLKRFYLKRHSSQYQSLPGIHILVICGVISTCGQLLTYPFALVRTRLQAIAVSNDPNQPHSALGQVKYIFKHEGISGFYRGIIPNFFKVIPAVGISWVIYEEVRKSLGATMT